MKRAVLVAWLAAGCVHVAPPDMTPDDTLLVQTVDGWTLPVAHYPGEGPPVLLVHGMGASHLNWDYRAEVSLAHALSEQGWDVWVPSMRGDPDTEGPWRLEARRYDFDDFAQLDLPAVVDAVLARTGERDLLWVGHSMGGILLYTALARYPHKIRAGVAVCSPGVFDDPVGAAWMVKAAAPLLGGDRRIPARALGRASVGLGRINPLISRVGNPDNLDRAVVNGMAKHALVDLTAGIGRQVVLWLREGELVDSWGEPYLTDADPEVPLLLMGAAADRIVAAADVEATCARYSQCEYRLLGLEGGMSLDYGHIDPVVGMSAPTEVYPIIVEFLDAHR